MLPPGALKPDYAGYCLSNLPASVMRILGVNDSRPRLPDGAFGDVDTSGVENVVLLLCDGFGYSGWKRQSDRGFFGALSKRGSVKPITTVFPSTTAAALTTVSTGMTPQEHGLPEWYVYFDEIGDIVVTLPFTRVGDRGRDTLEGELNPKALFDGRTIFQNLTDAGVTCTSLTSRGLAHSCYSSISHAGSQVVPYTTASDLTVSLRRSVERAKGRNLYYAYWSYVDSIEHVYGPNTDEAEVEASLISHAFQEGFLSKISREAAKRTMVLVTADHGQVPVDGESTLYLNRFAKLNRAFQRTPTGGKVRPWGGARDVYLRVADERLEEIEGYLQDKLDGVASVLTTQEGIRQGLFGINSPSRKFLRRIGNLMILPHGRKTVWYRYRKGDSLELRGHHGGLTEDEMTIPLAAARVSDLM